MFPNQFKVGSLLLLCNITQLSKIYYLTILQYLQNFYKGSNIFLNNCWGLG